jgi:hypothetical protein
MNNVYEIRGDITAISVSCKGKEFKTLISTSDLEKVKAFPNKWFANFDRVLESYYVMGRLLDGDDGNQRKTVILHRYLFDNPSGLVIDHINHDTLNNTRENLRAVTFAENQMNRKGARKDSKSGILGVSWDKKSRKWRSQIQINGIKKHLGFHEDINIAEKVVREERMKFMRTLTERAE